MREQTSYGESSCEVSTPELPGAYRDVEAPSGESVAQDGGDYNVPLETIQSARGGVKGAVT